MNGSRKPYLIFGALALLLYLTVAGSKELIHFVAGREMLVENLGALAFFISSCLFLAMAWRERASGAKLRLLQLVLLGAFFFVAFGEEASWGQHWFGFDTPEGLKKLNAQEETNLHNLWLIDSYAGDGEKKKGLAALLLNSNRLFDLIMIGLFWLLPLAARWPSWLRSWLERWGTPAPAAALGFLLLSNWLATGLITAWFVDGMIRHLAVSEIREFNYAVLCMLGALELWNRGKDGVTPSQQRPEAQI